MKNELSTYLKSYRNDIFTIKQYHKRKANGELNDILIERKNKAEMKANHIEHIINTAPRYRMILQFYYLDFMSYEEIANLLNLSIYTIKNYRYYGLQEIKKKGIDKLCLKF